MDKYQEVLASSQVESNDANVAAAVEKIVAKASEYASAEVYQYLFSSIDLTTLSTTDTQSSVEAFVKRVNDFDNDYPQYKNVAAICVYSNFAEVVSSTLEVTGVDIAVVAGGFPASQTFTEIKVAESAMAVAGGANEVDIVMSLGYYLDKNYEEMCDEIAEIKDAIKDAKLKVILETGALQKAEDIKNASLLSMYSGADFIKTSTGKIDIAATPEAAVVMCHAIRAYYEKTGRKVGFKAAGGIRDYETAKAMIAAGADRIGTSAGVAICEDEAKAMGGGLPK